MKTKRVVTITFSLLLFGAIGLYFFVQFVMGIKSASIPQVDGKIKYVTSEGNEVFSSSTAVVFNRPVQICDVVVENNIAHIKVSEFSIIRSPAMGVVTSAKNGTIEINHGNDTVSTIQGLTTLGVQEGDLVYAGVAIGTTEKEITFSVSVSELPLDMKWLIEEFVDNEENSMR